MLGAAIFEEGIGGSVGREWNFLALRDPKKGLQKGPHPLLDTAILQKVEYGVYREYTLALSKFIFNLLRDGCLHILRDLEHQGSLQLR